MNVYAHTRSGESQAFGDRVTQSGGEVGEFGVDVFGVDVDQFAIGGDDVDVIGEIRVVTSAGAGVDTSAHARIDQGVERVVDGRETCAGGTFADEFVQLFSRGMAAAGGERLVDVGALTCAADVVTREGLLHVIRTNAARCYRLVTQLIHRSIIGRSLRQDQFLIQ